ncbi:hypothetical protein NPA08_04070 [Mycoplasmopsis citelli]|uniref:hypothetical protein n=1 Tax=Mycoplasmopsis citelli TaxID=171281 RepID=UPI002113A75D|nr:hypothetical protein [Mycoplasmopsis citelli]UUD36101.1 hypothetical protein NPA08_04070 [Mycoplasmopsis citelli]
MKKILNLLSITSAAILPVSVAISCTSKKPRISEQGTIEFSIINQEELEKALKASDKSYITLYFRPSKNQFHEYRKEPNLLSVPKGTPELKGLKSDGVTEIKSIKLFYKDYKYPNNNVEDVKVKQGYVVIQYLLNDKLYQQELKLPEKASGENNSEKQT